MNNQLAAPDPPSLTGPSLRLNPIHWPMYLRVMVGVGLGICIGVAFGTGDIGWGLSTKQFGVVASLYIQLLTALATPLIFLAIVDAFVRTHISGRQGIRMFLVCGVNIAVAFAIGLFILNVWQPGRSWQWATGSSQPGSPGDVPALDDSKVRELAQSAKQVSLSPLDMLRSYVPKSITHPFSDNMVLTVAVLAIVIGAALRSVRDQAEAGFASAVQTFEALICVSYRLVLTILTWLIELAPVAICLAVSSVIGSVGVGVFRVVGGFFGTVVAALALHSLVYYPLSAWWIGGKSPREFFREGIAAILTGFSINSSLATAPMTLDALQRLGVSESSARLSACVGTNFNNDGITLYEAITALFIAQAAGMSLSIGEQLTILLAALAGSMGIAGIPNSGLIILTLVLKAARLPDDVVQRALPIVYSIDFINARLRSAVNVMGDMQVAIMLDAFESHADTTKGT